jgi:hypothetical protein
MYTVNKNGDNTNSAVISITADTLADIEELPTNCLQGSDCLVLEDSSVWIFGGDGKWHKIG